MLLSLLKVCLLSLLSISFPSLLADSSIQDHTANNVERINPKKLSYDGINHTITLTADDFSKGYLSNFTYGNTVVSNVSYTLYISLVDNEYINSYQFVTYQYKTNMFIGETDYEEYDDFTIFHKIYIDFESGSMTLRNYLDGSLTSFNRIDYVQFVYASVNGYSSFFYSLADYICLNTCIEFTPTLLNNYYFKGFTDYIISNPSVLQYSSLVYNEMSSSIITVHSDNIKFEIYDGFIYLFSDKTEFYVPYYIFYGVTGGSASWGEFTESLYLYVNDFDNYYTLLPFFNQRTSILNNFVSVENFTFNFDFNYNAPYNSDLSETFVSESSFTVANIGTNYHIYKTYDLPFFMSNGQLYNQVRVEYINGCVMRYQAEQPSNNIIHFPTNNGDGLGYFNSLSYVNTSTGAEKFVYFRKFSQYTDTNDDLQTYLDKGGNWVNTDYRYLKFVSKLTPNEKNSLGQFNNSNPINGINGSNNFDVGSVLTLIGNTMASYASFFNITVLPGITLGILILVPFAITMLLFIISLFKR